MEIVRRKADCCSAMSEQTYVKDEIDLAFCQHHANKHEIVLLTDGWVCLTNQDETIDTRTLVPVEQKHEQTS